MILAIDAGNSRIKWGLHDGSGWSARGALATADAAALADLADLARTWPQGLRAVVCNVAGSATGQAIEAALRPCGGTLLRFRASAGDCGVSNHYENPERLGADRWAALLGARGLGLGDCLVVCAGTATTIDPLGADGAFRGGVILPGFDLMRASLAGNTAQLPLADGEFRPLPTNTMDAIVSGCLQAQLGAIERMFAAIAARPGACCVITGGAAPRLLPWLSMPVRHEESLILEGLVRYALSSDSSACAPDPEHR